MARLPRLTVPGHVHHLIQRGNNGQPVFSSPADYETLLDLIGGDARTCQVEIHAYVLLVNSFHLLATPLTAEGLPRLMQAVGRRYVRSFNQRQGRTGTLWEGRYRCTLIQPDRYLLPCMAYLDLRPVGAGLVADAKTYAWSSHAHYAGRRIDKLVTPHPLYWTLGNTPFAREAAYSHLVEAGVGEKMERALTDSALLGWALGDDAYVEGLQKLTERRVSQKKSGRPRSIGKLVCPSIIGRDGSNDLNGV